MNPLNQGHQITVEWALLPPSHVYENPETRQNVLRLYLPHCRLKPGFPPCPEVRRQNKAGKMTGWVSDGKISLRAALLCEAGKPINLPVPQLPHLQSGTNNTFLFHRVIS